MIAVIILLLLIIGFLGYKLSQKRQLDESLVENQRKQLETIHSQIVSVQEKYNDLYEQTNEQMQEYSSYHAKCLAAEEKLAQQNEELQRAMDTYQSLTRELDTNIDAQRQAREEALDKELKSKKELYFKESEDARLKCEILKMQYHAEIKAAEDTMEQEKKRADEAIAYQQSRYNTLLAPIRQYEMDKQAKLFYTIQLPEEYHEDIEFLLTTVAAKVQHQDIISKLVWAEYVKPYLDDTFKRIEIKEEAGIYKLTNINDSKAYIGKSTNVKKRIVDHFKSSVGIRAIADQAVHHAILKEGFWNWTIEVITYCDKEKLSELEKYYIDFFKTQEYGYNRREGG